MPEELIPIFLFASIAAVMILRPLTKRIGLVIERAYEDKKKAPDPQIERLTQLMERLVDRMDRMEDRLDFTERVLERQRAAATLTPGPTPQHSQTAGGERAGERRDRPSPI